MDNIETIKKKYNGNNMLHFSCIRGESKKISKILKKYPKLFYISNDYGETCAHLLINNGWFDIFKKYYLIYPDILNYIDNDNNNILQITKTEDLIDWIIDNTKKTYYNCFDNINSDNNTLCLNLILNDKVELLRKIIKIINLNIPKEFPPLIYASELNKVDSVKLILDHDINLLNIKDTEEHTPLIKSTISKAISVTKLLLDKGANIYYGGLENNDYPINICIKNKDIYHLNLFLQYYGNLNFIDKFLNTPLHNILYSYKNEEKWCSLDIIYLILSLGDINKKNLENISPLDLLKEIKIDNCFTLLIKPKMEDEISTSEIELPEIKHAYFSLFNPNIFHNYIYTIILLKKYNFIIPYQNRDNYENDLKILNYKFYKTFDEEDLWNMYKNHFVYYEFLPHLIIWKSTDLYYINKNFVKIIKNIMVLKVRFIYLKLTLLVHDGGKHSNILIYDIIKKELIRFEPYGNAEVSDNDMLNKKLKDLFEQIDKDAKIILPKDYLYDTGFQNISNDSLNIKSGDPGGFCLAWSLWFLELKLNNPDEDNHILVKNAFDNIKLDYNKKYIKKIDVNIIHNNPFLNYIRDYANNLDNEKNKYLLDKGISKDEIYNNYFTKETKKKIIGFILDDFSKLKIIN